MIDKVRAIALELSSDNIKTGLALVVPAEQCAIVATKSGNVDHPSLDRTAWEFIARWIEKSDALLPMKPEPLPAWITKYLLFGCTRGERFASIPMTIGAGDKILACLAAASLHSE